jgi:uncharacterized membrane protein YqjE
MYPGGEEENRTGRAVPRQSLGELFRQLAENASELIRHELELAKKEMLEKLKTCRAATIALGIGALLGVLGLFMLCAACFIGLAAHLGYGVSALSLGILLTLVGTVVAVSAVQKFKRTGLAPRQTIETLEENKEWLRELT